MVFNACFGHADVDGASITDAATAAEVRMDAATAPPATAPP